MNCCTFFFSISFCVFQLPDIVQDNFAPTWEDYFRVRVRTTGIVQDAFVDPHRTITDKWQVFLTGGQRNERKKVNRFAFRGDFCSLLLDYQYYYYYFLMNIFVLLSGLIFSKMSQ